MMCMRRMMAAARKEGSNMDEVYKRLKDEADNLKKHPITKVRFILRYISTMLKSLTLFYLDGF